MIFLTSFSNLTGLLQEAINSWGVRITIFIHFYKKMQRRQFLHNGVCLGAACLIPVASPSLASAVPAVSPLAAPLTEPLQPIWEAAVGGNWDTVRQWLQINPNLIGALGEMRVDYHDKQILDLFHFIWQPL